MACVAIAFYLTCAHAANSEQFIKGIPLFAKMKMFPYAGSQTQLENLFLVTLHASFCCCPSVIGAADALPCQMPYTGKVNCSSIKHFSTKILTVVVPKYKVQILSFDRIDNLPCKSILIQYTSPNATYRAPIDVLGS